MSLAFGNLFDALPSLLEEGLHEESVESLAETRASRIERIVSTGQASPEGFWYDQETDELVVLLRGAASLEIAGRADPLDMAPGGWVLLPAHCRHRVARTSEDEPTLWLAVHFPPAT